MAMVGSTGKAAGLGVGTLAVTKAGAFKVAITVMAIVSIVSITGHIHKNRFRQRAHQPLSLEQNRSTGPERRVTRVLPEQGVGAPLPSVDAVGQFPDIDLSTPENAVHSLMRRVGRQAVDQLGQCLAQGTGDRQNSPYLRCLTGPIEVLDVYQQGDTAHSDQVITAQAARPQIDPM